MSFTQRKLSQLKAWVNGGEDEDENGMLLGAAVLDGECQHKPLFKPIKPMDFIGTFTLIILMALATMGGIGGGGVVVLLIQQLLYFELKEAIALSQFSIFTCALARYVITFSDKHPEKP